MKRRGRPKLPDSDRMVGRCIWLKSQVWSEIKVLARCGNETESESYLPWQWARLRSIVVTQRLRGGAVSSSLPSSRRIRRVRA
jgi:hypothetical protein